MALKENLKNLQIKKRGTIGNRKYIVIKVTGKTKLNDIAKKFGKNYYLGFGTWMADNQSMVLYKREKPLSKSPETYSEWRKN